MRKLLMSLTVLAGTTVAAASAANAAPLASPIHVEAAMPHVQTVQYYEDWRYREWRRHEAWEHWRRHEEWRRWHQYRGW